MLSVSETILVLLRRASSPTVVGLKMMLYGFAAF